MNGLGISESSGTCLFPRDFLWGAATSSYQVEGAVNEDGRGRSIWDSFCQTPGRIQSGENGNVACDSYHRMDEDLRLLTELGVGAYRFSISWARVQPDGSGAINRAGLYYYRTLVHELRHREIRPVVTVYHWELPQALEDRGGWASRETAERFAEYAALLAESLGDEVGMWITLNEPLQSAHQGYRIGTHAPGHTDYELAAAATHHLLLGHGLALQAIRAHSPAPVGIALDPNPIRAAEESALEIAAQLDAEQNRMYVDPVLHGTYPSESRPEMLPPDELVRDGDMSIISMPLDFLGVNYYRTHYIRHGDWDDLRHDELPVADHPGVVHVFPADLPRTVMNWIVEPDGLYRLLLAIGEEAPGLPLYVTENGCAADDYVNPDGEVNDFARVDYLHAHLAAIWRAIGDGANVSGYFHWSLMDNFEWAWGYRRRFGLYFVDFGTQRRIAKRSARFYSDVARSGELPAREDVLTPWDYTPRSPLAGAATSPPLRERSLAVTDGSSPASVARE
jgi:beta-glucosidase